MNGRVAAVLGVGPGLGAAVARRFARGGYAVALMARSEESVTGVREEIEGSAFSITVDATDPGSVAFAFDGCFKANCAGACSTPVTNTSPSPSDSGGPGPPQGEPRPTRLPEGLCDIVSRC
jgi:NAD(P)-dependent dehydrogenase (short-subunit alcohol dehydrogenase family)